MEGKKHTGNRPCFFFFFFLRVILHACMRRDAYFYLRVRVFWRVWRGSLTSSGEHPAIDCLVRKRETSPSAASLVSSFVKRIRASSHRKRKDNSWDPEIRLGDCLFSPPAITVVAQRPWQSSSNSGWYIFKGNHLSLISSSLLCVCVCGWEVLMDIWCDDRAWEERVQFVLPPCIRSIMRFVIHLFCSVGVLCAVALSETIRLPSLIRLNQSLSSTSVLYLCHLHQLNNSNELFLQGYDVIHGDERCHVHHLLVYECSIKDLPRYSGLCGMHNALSMPQLVYRHCQTRILIAWARGGQSNYTYPTDTGLKFDPDTHLLLEVHFEPSIPREYSIGVRLRFYPSNEQPRYEVGVLTLGTLARSPLFLPPHLETIHFPTYCSRDCLNYFLRNHSSISVFAALVHAHRRATRITLEAQHLHRTQRLLDRNPFEFHRQEMLHFSRPYPQITANDELSLLCSYSTRHDYFKAIRGGYASDEEMCQGFLYYYPKIPSFPLCISLPLYTHSEWMNESERWTDHSSLLAKQKLESNVRHLTMCGDNIISEKNNQSMLRSSVYQRSMQALKPLSFDMQRFFFSAIYTMVVLLVLFALICSYLTIHTRDVLLLTLRHWSRKKQVSPDVPNERRTYLTRISATQITI